MTWGQYAHRLDGGLPEVDRERLARIEPAVAAATRAPGPPHVQAVLDLQRAAGNAAVVQLLRRVGGTARAGVPVAQRQDEEQEDGGQSWATDEEAQSSSYTADDYSSGEAYGPPPPPELGDEGGQSWATNEEAPSEAAPGEETPAGESGEEAGEHSQEEIDRKIAEGESGRESDEFVPMGGGPSPIATAGGSISAADLGGFHDDGQIGIVPFGPRGDGDDPAEAMDPRAYVPGGSTGTVTWSGGGGEGKGPKGNQGSGSIQKEIIPDYDYNWGGPNTKASAFVVTGTGILDIHRNFVTSASGDQGNGFWLSPRAAAALTAHEQKHVTRAKAVYDSSIQPMLDRVAKSATYGKEITYWGSDAKALVKRHIDWPKSVNKFTEEDQNENAPSNRVDNEDIGSDHYPFNEKGPKTIEGKEYQSYTVMKGEQPPP